MKLAGQAVVVTGGGSGTGAALCRAFRAAGAARIVVANIDAQVAQAVAAEAGGTAFACDFSDEGRVIALVDAAEQAGPIGLCCSNVGVAVMDAVAGNAASARSWSVNVMAHAYAARALVPRMAAVNGGRNLPKRGGRKIPTSLRSRCAQQGSATVLGTVKGRAPERAPQAVSSLDGPCAPRPLMLVGTEGVPTFDAPPAGRTKGDD